MLILNYHHVGYPPKGARYRGMYVSPQILAWQVKLLKARGLRFVTVSEGVKAGCPANTCALTFDDGYKDNLDLGLPVLQRAGVPATVYVVTGLVGQSSVVWSEAGDKTPSELMSWNDLKHLASAGWEIGSHASDHVHLARRSRDEQKIFLEDSWRDFKEQMGQVPRSFAYPYGSLNNDTVELLANLGCENAVTTESSGTNTSLTPPLLLYRKPARGHAMHHAVQSLGLLWQT